MDGMQQKNQEKTPGIAIAAIIFAILLPIVGIILGIIALVKINKTESGEGKGLAIAAIVVGVIMALIILPVLMMILIGSIAYYGILDPGRFLPDRCQFENPILCTENFIIQKSITGTLEVELINNYGSQILVTNAVVEDIEGKKLGCDEILLDNVSIAKGNQEMVWEQGSRKNLVVNCVNGDRLDIQESARFEIEMQWYPSNYEPSKSRIVRGEIFSRVMPKPSDLT